MRLVHDQIPALDSATNFWWFYRKNLLNFVKTGEELEWAKMRAVHGDSLCVT